MEAASPDDDRDDNVKANHWWARATIDFRERRIKRFPR
jgi:hypothetical protein